SPQRQTCPTVFPPPGLWGFFYYLSGSVRICISTNLTTRKQSTSIKKHFAVVAPNKKAAPVQRRLVIFQNINIFFPSPANGKD
ncbi:MAG: hypothetical protein OES29_05360, partial [Desulfuromonadales bacterium]|nr:hypothetical protein [Desulfuromonadales bacterium]